MSLTGSLRTNAPSSRSSWPIRLVILWCVMLPSCALALQGHSTIEGKPFPSHRAGEVTKGQTAEQVRSVLGDPVEITERDGVTTWRYFEKFHPRACSTLLFGMTISSPQPQLVEAIVTIRDGLVQDVTAHDSGARR